MQKLPILLEQSLKPKSKMRLFFSCLFLVSFLNVFSQEEKAPATETPKVKIDSLYREDQFYFAITYNALANAPEGLSQKKFSAGLNFGFLRDMPINKNRNVSIATGLGFSYKNYFQNLAITGTNDAPVYNVVNYSDVNTNKFTQYLIDLPIEFRWRTSTFESYKFWRIYGGVKFSYLLFDRSVYKDSEQKVVIKNNKDFEKIQYGVYISSGFNTWNIYAYYGLNSLFKSAKTPTEDIDMRTMNIGLIFYVL
ncbi:porin family protein [Flavobacterium sp. PS2]|uniref:porin family protein n=1 Tax=Flavobacterium sp. PS2 TaxID=3384157 RepID=UPI00390CB249